MEKYRALIQKLNEVRQEILASPQYSYNYAREVGTDKEIEKSISASAAYSYLYALTVLKGRFLQGEVAISKDDYYSKRYAKEVLKFNFKDGYDLIIDSVFLKTFHDLVGVNTPEQAYYYAKLVRKGRFKEGEHLINKSSAIKEKYEQFLKEITSDF